MPLYFGLPAGKADGYAIGSAALAATLTAAYSGNTYNFQTDGNDYAIIYVTYTPAENTRNCYLQIEGGPNSSDFFLKSSLLDSISGESTLLSHTAKLPGATSGTAYKMRWEVPIADKCMRISVKEDGAGTFGTVTVQMILRQLP